MAQIYNSELTKNMIDAIKASTARDNLPAQLAEKVVPVIDVHPNHNKFTAGAVEATATNSATGSVALPTGKQCYLTGISLSFIKDATSTSTFTDAKVVINGVATRVAKLASITLVAQSEAMYIPFDRPIKLDLNTSCYVNNSTAVANITSIAVFHYYYEEIN